MTEPWISSDLQKTLLFILPALAAIATATISMSRGFSVGATVFMLLCAAIALYFLPDFVALF